MFLIVFSILTLSSSVLRAFIRYSVRLPFVNMAVSLFNMRVKNTFLQFDDDSLSDLSIDEEDTPRRQVTEPMPSIKRLLEIPVLNVPKHKMTFENASAHSTDYSESPEDFESSRVDTLTESIASSEHDLKVMDPFHAECELGHPDCGNVMAWQVRSERSWNDWSDEQCDTDAEQFDHDSCSRYTDEPQVHTLGAAARPGHCDAPEKKAVDRSAYKQKGFGSDACTKAKPVRRRKHESLIDLAARKNKDESSQTTELHQPQQRFGPPTSNVQPSYSSLKDTSKADFNQTKSCRTCGGQFQLDFKFCRFCGAAFSAPRP
jgi:hypothetical protein